MIFRTNLKLSLSATIIFSIAVSVACMLFLSSTALGANDITRVSTDSDGSQIWNGSGAPAISADGRYIAFTVFPSFLAKTDPFANGYWCCPIASIFRKDTATGEILQVTTDSNNVPVNYNGYDPAISADGRYVAFYSENGNINVKDMDTGQIQVANTSADGQILNGDHDWGARISMSADGRYIAFSLDYMYSPPCCWSYVKKNVYVKDMVTGNITMASTDSNGAESGVFSENPAISADGRYVAFQSRFPDLAPQETYSAGGTDVFVKDLVTGETKLVSTPKCKDQFDGELGITSCVYSGPYSSSKPSISADGRYISFESISPDMVPGDTNGATDIFVKDMESGSTQRVSTGSYGSEGFGGDASNGGNGAYSSSISGDGRYVAFWSGFNNLVSDDTNNKFDVFVKDTATDVTIRLSTDVTGVEGNLDSVSPSISRDGHYVAFASNASNLVQDDTNHNTDVFKAAVDIPLLDPCLTCGNMGTGLIPGDIVITADLSGGLPGLGAYAIIPGFWKHMGMYVGNGKVVEAISSGVELTPLSNWVNDKKWVDYLRVNTDQPTREKAVTFELNQAGYNRAVDWSFYPTIGKEKKKYEYWLFAKNSDPNLQKWYCSEIIWAAYINASNNQVDLSDVTLAKILTFPQNWLTYLSGSNQPPDKNLGITPTDIRNSTHITKIGEHHNALPPLGYTPFYFQSDCPVDLEVTDPQGRVTNISSDSIPGATYGRDIDENGRIRSWVGIPQREQGNYQISVIPWSVAQPTDTYSVSVNMENNTGATLADNVSLSDTNIHTYTFDSQPFDLPLSLRQSGTYWGSYADYTARQLSVDMTIANNGNNNAFGVQINNSSNTNGVLLASATPILFGDITAGNQNTATLKYEVPAGISMFRSSIFASANDPGGFSHNYP